MQANRANAPYRPFQCRISSASLRLITKALAREIGTPPLSHAYKRVYQEIQ